MLMKIRVKMKILKLNKTIVILTKIVTMNKKADKLEVNKNLHQRIRRRERNNRKVKTKNNDDEINNILSYLFYIKQILRRYQIFRSSAYTKSLLK